MPKDVLGKGLTASALKELDLANGHGDDEREFETETLASRVSQLSIRPQHETLEEKRYAFKFPSAINNRVFYLLRHLGWVDLDFGCSTVCQILLGLMGIWHKRLAS